MGLQSPLGGTHQETDVLREGGANPSHGSDRGLGGQPHPTSLTEFMSSNRKTNFYHFLKCYCVIGSGKSPAVPGPVEEQNRWN